MNTKPPRIVDGLDLNELEEGLVVYQEATDKVHHLNHTASVVLQLCDGTHDAGAIAAFLARAFELSEPPVDETVSCIERLRDQGLIR